MTIDEIINYVIETPENTNPAVLKDMLNQLNTGGGNIPATFTWNLTISSSTCESNMSIADLCAYKANETIITCIFNGEEYSVENIYIEGQGLSINITGEGQSLYVMNSYRDNLTATNNWYIYDD